MQRIKQFLRQHPLSRREYIFAAIAWNRLKVFLYQRIFGGYYTPKYFDRLFATTLDPWSFRGNAIAEERRRLIIGMLSGKRYSRLLEIGCAEGWMTPMLANLADELVSVEVSKVALERAREECKDVRNIIFQQMDIVVDPLPGGIFDCIVCAGVLVYLPMNVQQNLCGKIVASLQCGGNLLLEHVRKPSPGEVAQRTVHSLYQGNPELSEVHNQDEEEYTITMFRKVAS